MSSNSIDTPLNIALKENLISDTTSDNVNETIQGTTNSINNINPFFTEAINNENNEVINKNNKLSHENLFSPTDNFINTVITNSKSNDSIMNETPLVSQSNQDLFDAPYIMEINDEHFPTEIAKSINNEQKENSYENDNLTVTPKIQTENSFENSLNIIHDSTPIEGIKLKNHTKRKNNIGEIQTQPEKIQITKTNIPNHVENLFMDINDIVSPINIIDAVMHNQSNQINKQSQNNIDFNLIPSIEDESPIAEQPVSAFPINDLEEDIDDLIDHELSQCNYIEKVESDNNAANNKKLHENKPSDFIDVHENNTFEARDIHKNHDIMAKPSSQKMKLNKEVIETKVNELNENEAKDGKSKLGIDKKKKIEVKESPLNTNNKNKLEKTKITSTTNRSNDVFARLTKDIYSSASKNKSPISNSPSSYNSTHSTSIHTSSSHTLSHTTKTTTSINKLIHKPLNRSSSSSTTSSKTNSLSSPKPTTKNPMLNSASTTSANSNNSKISLSHKPSSIDTTSKTSSPKPHSSTSKTGIISPRSSFHKSTTTSTTTTKATKSSFSPPASVKPKLSDTSIITKPKVSVNSSTTKPKINTSASDTSKTSRIGLVLKTATSKTPSKSSSTPNSDKIRYSLTSTSPDNKISAISKPKLGVTTFTTRMTSTTTANSLTDKEIIEKQSKEIEKLKQMIMELNNQIEEQTLISFISQKQDLNTINDLKEKLKQLSENNIENNKIDEFTEFMNESFNIIENLAFLIDTQEQNYGKLKVETAKINQNLANVTLLCDDEHIKRIMDEKMYKKEIQRLQEMATSLNDSLSKVTLLCDEIKKVHSKGIENLDNKLQNTKQLSLHDLSESSEISKLRHDLACINSKLANVTLLCDQINKEKNNNINNLKQQVEYFKKLTVELNNRITNLTFHCDQVEYDKSSLENNSDNSTLTQELDECKMMLEQKDIYIQQLQMQIKQLEQKDLVIQQLQMQIEQLKQKNTKEENEVK